MGVFTIIYFVFKKASKSLKNSKNWFTAIKVLFGVGLAAELVLLGVLQKGMIKIYKIRQIKPEQISQEEEYVLKKQVDMLSCTSSIWLTNQTIILVEVIIFYYWVRLVSKKVLQEI